MKNDDQGRGPVGMRQGDPDMRLGAAVPGDPALSSALEPDQTEGTAYVTADEAGRDSTGATDAFMAVDEADASTPASLHGERLTGPEGYEHIRITESELPGGQ